MPTSTPDANARKRTHRSHRKSRNGCLTCKRRRIKCNEHRPTCANCAYRHSPCQYNDVVDFVEFVPSLDLKLAVKAPVSHESHLRDTVDKDTTPEAIQIFLSGIMSRVPRSPLSNQAPVIADSALLAHYHQHTSLSMAAGADQSACRSIIWSQVIPLVAFQCKCVSHALTALAAISIWSERTNHPKLARDSSQSLTDRYLYRAELHYGHCLSQLRAELDTLGRHNVDAVLACSALLVPYGFAHSRAERLLSRSRRKSEPEGLQSGGSCCDSSPPPPLSSISWISLLQGLLTVQSATQQQHVEAGKSAILPLIEWNEDDFATKTAQGLPGNDFTFSDHPLLCIIATEGDGALIRLQQQLLSRLEHRQASSRTVNDIRICIEALESLRSFTTQFLARDSPNQRILIAWIATLHKSFLNLLARENVYALSVHAHFLVYTILLEHLWYIGDLGVGSIWEMLERVGVSRQYHIDAGTEEKEKGSFGIHGEAGDQFDQYELFAWPLRMASLHGCDRVINASFSCEQGTSLGLR